MKPITIDGVNIFTETHHNAQRWTVTLGRRFTQAKAVKRRFETYQQARDWALEQVERKKAQGAGAFSLSAGQLEQATRALNVLAGRATLTEAVEFFVKVRFPEAGTKTTGEVVAEWVKDAKTIKKLSPDYLDTIEHIYDSLAARFPGNISEITAKELEEFIASKKRRDGLPIAGETFNHYVNDCHALFNFAIERGWLGHNPAAEIRERGTEKKEVGIITPTETLAILNAAAAEEASQFVPFVALGAFAGLRTGEISRLDWADVILDDEPRVIIRPKAAKGGEPRVVDLPANLVAWLKLYHFRKGKVVVPTSRPLKRLRAAIGRKWPHNAARHSFVSYRARLHGEAVASEQAGHESLKTTRKHYKKYVSTKAAAAYFGITPDTTQEQLNVMLAPTPAAPAQATA